MPASDSDSNALQFLRLEQQGRRYISQRLHDDLQQMMVAAKMILQKYMNSRRDEDLKEAIQILDETLVHTRDLTTELSPPLLFKSGLRAAFEWLIRWLRDRHGLKAHVVVEGEDRPVPEEVGHFLLWSAKQILLHGSKNEGFARIRLEFHSGCPEILIQGSAIHLFPLGPELLEVKERVQLLQGELQISNQGEECRLFFPLSIFISSPS